jgi:aspartyl/asparaginyl beta-hydroxylase (cupin superfamily)
LIIYSDTQHEQEKKGAEFSGQKTLHKIFSKTVIKSTTRFIVASMCIFYAPSLAQVSSFPELEHLESEVRPVASPPTLLRRQNFAGKATSHT